MNNEFVENANISSREDSLDNNIYQNGQFNNINDNNSSNSSILRTNVLEDEENYLDTIPLDNTHTHNLKQINQQSSNNNQINQQLTNNNQNITNEPKHNRIKNPFCIEQENKLGIKINSTLNYLTSYDFSNPFANNENINEQTNLMIIFDILSAIILVRFSQLITVYITSGRMTECVNDLIVVEIVFLFSYYYMCVENDSNYRWSGFTNELYNYSRVIILLFTAWYSNGIFLSVDNTAAPFAIGIIIIRGLSAVRGILALMNDKNVKNNIAFYVFKVISQIFIAIPLGIIISTYGKEELEPKVRTCFIISCVIDCITFAFFSVIEYVKMNRVIKEWASEEKSLNANIFFGSLYRIRIKYSRDTLSLENNENDSISSSSSSSSIEYLMYKSIQDKWNRFSRMISISFGIFVLLIFQTRLGVGYPDNYVAIGIDNDSFGYFLCATGLLFLIDRFRNFVNPITKMKPIYYFLGPLFHIVLMIQAICIPFIIGSLNLILQSIYENSLFNPSYEYLMPQTENNNYTMPLNQLGVLNIPLTNWRYAGHMFIDNLFETNDSYTTYDREGSSTKTLGVSLFVFTIVNIISIVFFTNYRTLHTRRRKVAWLLVTIVATLLLGIVVLVPALVMMSYLATSVLVIASFCTLVLTFLVACPVAHFVFRR